MASMIEAKQKFTSAVRDEIERDIRAMIDGHPTLSQLPERDRRNATYAATDHLLLAIRAASVAKFTETA